MKTEYIKVIKEQGEFDFEVSSIVEGLTQAEYEELKSMLITAIGTMEIIRRNNNDEEDEFEDIEELFAGVELEYNKNSLEYKINQLIKNQKKIIERLKER